MAIRGSCNYLWANLIIGCASPHSSTYHGAHLEARTHAKPTPSWWSRHHSNLWCQCCVGRSHKPFRIKMPVRGRNTGGLTATIAPWLMILLIVFLAKCTRAHQGEPRKHGICPRDWTGLLAVDECTKYISCENGKPAGSPIPCANGTFFHEALQICEYSSPTLLRVSRCGRRLRGRTENSSPV